MSTMKMATVKLDTKKTSPKKVRTVILKKETIIKNGKKMVKVVKGFIKKKINNDKSDFLE